MLKAAHDAEEFYEDRGARISILAGRRPPRPDTLKQTDQPSISTKPLQTGRAIRFQQYLRGTCRSRRKAGRRKSGCPTELVAGQAQGRDSPFLACSSDVATMEDSKPFAVRLLDLQRRERKGHGFRAAAEASGRSSEEPVAKPNAAATRRTWWSWAD